MSSWAPQAGIFGTSLVATASEVKASEASGQSWVKVVKAHGRQGLRRLRVCHAFPSEEPMSVAWRDRLLTDEPLSYKSCRDLELPGFEAGEELHIGLRNGPSNTFQISVCY